MRHTIYIALVLAIASCSPSLPDKYSQSEALPAIYPDYVDVTLPPNIAPPTFRIEIKGDEYITSIGNKGNSIVLQGQDVMPDIDEWHALTEASKGQSLEVAIYVRRGEEWTKYKSFNYHIAQEPIDEWLSYRLIAPSYVAYEQLTINQRNLTNYYEGEIYNNMLLTGREDGQCVNCHSYQNYDPGNMQFHTRQHLGGTMIVTDGKMQKVDLKTDSTLSAGVYPAWHPKQKVIAYSVNTTGQSFHTKDLERVEVQDSHSDLILYDIASNTVSSIITDTTALQCFPAWSPDGKWLYYCSAPYIHDSRMGDRGLMDMYQQIKYSLYRKPYDEGSKTFGEAQLIFDADSTVSATLPRVSPDGKYLAFAHGDYGVFHIWHKSSDIWLLNLTDPAAEAHPMQGINSSDVESYHSWSSNGKWMVVSSRRDDGSYTRPYIAYIRPDGSTAKPFIVPQSSPDFYPNLFRSYNIPEFMKDKVKITPQEFASELKKEPLKAIFKSR